MRRSRAAAGSALFFALAPGVVAGLVPFLITQWRVGPGDAVWLRVLGAVLIAISLPSLVAAFLRFVREGLGTPAPVAPTEHLVVGGIYRHVRNPMYLAVVSCIIGQALLLRRPVLLPYAAGMALLMVLFVRGYEEPTLRARYGQEYEAYRRAVPGWWPRLRPYRPGPP